jgi:hypothetical protein
MIDARKGLIIVGAAWFIMRTAQNRAFSNNNNIIYDAPCGFLCSELAANIRMGLFVLAVVLAALALYQNVSEKSIK